MMGHFGRFGVGPVGNLAASGSYWWLGLVAMAIKLIFWVVIIVLAYRIIKSLIVNYSSNKKMTDNNALAILRERYAKGEIDTEEFNQRKSQLQ